MLDADGNEIVGEDDSPLTVETNLKVIKYNNALYFDGMSLTMLVAELYEKGIDIGWETKILDPFVDKIREIHNAN
jgi:hypothetical protein